jgi:hypothetical protein
MTNTFVRAEDSDADPRVHDFRSVPRDLASPLCESSSQQKMDELASVKTHTEVQKEEARTDAVEARFSVLSRGALQ